MLAAEELRKVGPARTLREAKQNVLRAIDATAARLGNTRAVCRKYYIHPELLGAYMEGDVLPPAKPHEWEKREAHRAPLRKHESEVLDFLKSRLAAKEAKTKSGKRKPPATRRVAAGRAQKEDTPAVETDRRPAQSRTKAKKRKKTSSEKNGKAPPNEEKETAV
jgi:DNA topoisomerase-1